MARTTQAAEGAPEARADRVEGASGQAPPLSGTLCAPGDVRQPRRAVSGMGLPAVIAGRLAELGAQKAGDLPAIRMADYLALPGASQAQIDVLRRFLAAVPAPHWAAPPKAAPKAGPSAPSPLPVPTRAPVSRPAPPRAAPPKTPEAPETQISSGLRPGPTAAGDAGDATFVERAQRDLAGLPPKVADVTRGRFGLGRPVEIIRTLMGRHRISMAGAEAMEEAGFRSLSEEGRAVSELRARLEILAFEGPVGLDGLLEMPWLRGLAPEGFRRLVWAIRSPGFTVVPTRDPDTGYGYALVPMDRKAWEANFAKAKEALAGANPRFPVVAWANAAWEAMGDLDPRRRQAVLDGFGPVGLGDSVSKLQARHLDQATLRTLSETYPPRPGGKAPPETSANARRRLEGMVRSGIDLTPWVATYLVMRPPEARETSPGPSGGTPGPAPRGEANAGGQPPVPEFLKRALAGEWAGCGERSPERASEPPPARSNDPGSPGRGSPGPHVPEFLRRMLQVRAADAVTESPSAGERAEDRVGG